VSRKYELLYMLSVINHVLLLLLQHQAARPALPLFTAPCTTGNIQHTIVNIFSAAVAAAAAAHHMLAEPAHYTLPLPPSLAQSEPLFAASTQCNAVADCRTAT
jgi:hypothetical protein